MVKVITYGTYDLLHIGHVNFLERAKKMGDYLIVGVTTDDFDKNRGKINVQQSLMERINAVRATGLADEIVVEEYEGQKIDDIRKYGVDIFTVGIDWKGKFDYLNEYCKVVYMERTEGISSSELRTKNSLVKLGLFGDALFLKKVLSESQYVNGIEVNALCTRRPEIMGKGLKDFELVTQKLENILDVVDAVYVRSQPQNHYVDVKKALESGKHVLCESPVTLSQTESRELFQLAKEKKLVLMEAMKTAYSTAFSRLVLLAKGGKIGEVVSVDATCTSLKHIDGKERTDWNGFYEWGPTALLPIFQILGTEYKEHRMVSHGDVFTKVDFVYDHAVASIKVGDGVKSEGELVITGTKGYIYVPAPWWNTDYFEIRYENPLDNSRYFYQLEGEGIRYELVAFAGAVQRGMAHTNIDEKITYEISEIMDDFVNGRNVTVI